MIRHISIFFLKEENKAEHKKLFLERLIQMEGKLDHVAAYQVGTDCMERPPKGIPGVPEFGDVVQVIDFADEAAALAYPDHPAHVSLAEDMGAYLEKVVAMDIRF